MGRRSEQAGALLMLLSAALMAAERLTGSLSDWLGQLFCGMRTMEPVNGIVGERSCGFDADMDLMVALAGSFLLGLFLYLGARMKKGNS
jgi:hypothetical protein